MQIDSSLDHDGKTEPAPASPFFTHSRVELVDGRAASFRYWWDGVEWLADNVPHAELDGAGRVLAPGGEVLGVYLDRFDEDGSPVDA